MNFIEETLEEFDKEFNKPIREDIGKFFNTPDSRHTYFDNTAIQQFLKRKLKEAYEKGRSDVYNDNDLHMDIHSKASSDMPDHTNCPRNKYALKCDHSETKDSLRSLIPECKHESIFKWLLGEEGNFPLSEPGKRYNFHTELREKLKAISERTSGRVAFTTTKGRLSDGVESNSPVEIEFTDDGSLGRLPSPDFTWRTTPKEKL